MKRIGILGATGSIGLNSVAVAQAHPDRFKIVYLTAYRQVDKLIELAKRTQPQLVVIGDESRYEQLKEGLSGSGIQCEAGYESIVALAGSGMADVVLNAIVGAAGLRPTLAAAHKGTDIALSNKESLVVAGDVINDLCAETGSNIYPVDSEHSAIWQCLAGEKDKDVEKLILTGSGGPFLNRDLATFKDITKAEALKHPNWSMGAKITIDSSTMVNKGLELIEACHLFHVPEDRIDIVIHPQSIVHSMVMFKDRSVKAQLGQPDMKIPIQYALSYPEHLTSCWEEFDITQIAHLDFYKPDSERFPAMDLARAAMKQGGTAPAVFNMANERAVYSFLQEKISYVDIVPYIEKALEEYVHISHPSEDELIELVKTE